MSSYRFCRTDDVALLVAAYNRCYRVHFPDLPEMTADRFKRLIRELNLWCSSCMVAVVDKVPVGVVLAAKREDEGESLILAVGVDPDHQRCGHGGHLMTSLSAKLAILGPPGLLAEVPAELGAACAFFEACGYRRERVYVDFEFDPAATGGSPPAAAPGMIVPITVDELVESGAFDPRAQRCWGRAPRTLLNRKDRIEGLAIASDRIEAWLLHEDDAETEQRKKADAPREILAFGCADPERSEALLGLLLRCYLATGSRPARIARVWEQEIPFAFLDGLGFRRGARRTGYVAVATPG